MDVRLYCFAHAGAGVSSFARWARHCGPGVEVVPLLLPGRELRRREPRVTTREALLADLLHKITDTDERPYALYGHSLGGTVAYTLTRALLESGKPAPQFLAVGASPAPHTVAPGATDELSDAELLDFVGDVGSAPQGALAERNSVWHRSVLPVLRDDLALARALRSAAVESGPAGRVPVPVLAVGGRQDPVIGAGALDGWARWTTGPLVRRTVPGDHFFVRGAELPRLMGRACRVARRIAAPVPAPVPVSPSGLR